MNELIYVARVALPSSAGYHSGPSGDTDYEVAYKKAIHEAVPDGFEVAWKTQSTWPKDKDGLTWVKLYCTDQKRAVEYWADKAAQFRKEGERLMGGIRALIGG